MSIPKLLMARAVFPEVLERLSKYFEVEANQSDTVWSKAELTERLLGKQAENRAKTDLASVDLCPLPRRFAHGGQQH